MARLARVVIPGLPHHLTQRGNRRGDIFFSAKDRRKFLSLLSESIRSGDVRVWAYCLMSNHIHLVLVPSTEDSLGLSMRRINSLYATYLNREQGWSGHVWENRFFSTPLDEAHSWTAVRYVERNPVRAGLAKNAEDYPWSSARTHCGLARDPIVSGDLEKAGCVGDWREWLQIPEDEAATTVREKTNTGRPCGNEIFTRRLEKLVGRPLSPRKAGRKTKIKE